MQNVHVRSPVQPLVTPGINVLQRDANNVRCKASCAESLNMLPTVAGSGLTFDLELGTNSKTPPPL